MLLSLSAWMTATALGPEFQQRWGLTASQVGWLTTIYPVLLSLEGQRTPGDALKAIKEQVRRIPHRGIGYGVLRYLCDDPEVAATLAALPRPEVNFLYLGQFDAAAPMQLLKEASGPPCSPDVPRGYLLEIVAFVMDGQLQVEWSYGEHRHRRDSAEAMARGFLEQLKALITHCLSPEAGGHTPSDFPAAKLSQADLDTLLSKIGRSGKGSGE